MYNDIFLFPQKCAIKIVINLSIMDNLVNHWQIVLFPYSTISGLFTALPYTCSVKQVTVAGMGQFLPS